MKQTVTFSRSECVQSVLGLLIGNDDIACLMQLSSDHCTSTVCHCTRFLCFLSRCQQTPNEVLEGTPTRLQLRWGECLPDCFAEMHKMHQKAWYRQV